MIATVHSPQRDLPISIPSVRRAVSFLLKHLHITTDQLVVHFVSKAKISALHASFFNDPSPTDCITFPIDKDPNLKPHVLGEIFICPQVAIEYAETRGIDPYEETTRYLVHGILHLIGYDDLTSKAYAKMHKKENASVKQLIANKHLITPPALKKKMIPD